jgi:hypothetical protein
LFWFFLLWLDPSQVSFVPYFFYDTHHALVAKLYASSVDGNLKVWVTEGKSGEQRVASTRKIMLRHLYSRYWQQVCGLRCLFKENMCLFVLMFYSLLQRELCQQATGRW